MQELVCIKLNSHDRKCLLDLLRTKPLKRRLILRILIVLMAAEGHSSEAIGEKLGISTRTAERWRDRFATMGFAGIEKEKPGRGRRAQLQVGEVQEIIRITLQTKPEDAARWSLRKLAALSGLSKSTIHRIWQAHGISPQMTRDLVS